MPDAISPAPTAAPDEALPDWGTISADNDFISLGAPDQLSILDDWSAHVGGRLKEGGATDEQLGDLTAFVDSARSEIEHSSDSRRAVRDLSAGGAFADVALFEDGSLPSETQRALSAPMMGTELLASMGIPDVWNASTKRRQAADDFANMREELISKVGDSKLGDLIIARDQKRAELQGEFDAQREERDRLFDEVDKTQDPKERTALEKQISAMEKKLDGLAIDLGLNKPGGEAAGTIAEMDKVVQDRQEQLRHADNGIDAKSSAASTFFSTWAKGSLESAPSRFTAWLFDKIYGSGKGDNVVEMMREQATKQQEQILAGRIPDGMSKAFVNPSLHETPAEQLARGTGHLMDWKTPMIFAGTPGFMAFGVGSAEQSYSDASKQTLAGGGSEHEATVNGLTAAAWTVPTLVAYMGMGKAAQALTSELLPLSATPLARAAVTFPVNVAANTVASGAIRKMQGEDFMPTNWIEHAVPDVMFALHSATEGYKSSAKIQKLTPTMEAVAAGTHPDILMRRMIADSPAFPDEVRTVALSEIAANQLAARKFLENTGRPIPAQQPLGDSEGAAQAQQRMLELAVERKQIMRRLNSPDEAPKPGDVARLAELQGEMKGLVTEALKRAEEPPAENKQEPEKKPAEEPAPARPAPGPDRAAVESTPLPEGFEPLRARLSSQLDDALADLEWAHNTSDPNEIASAETGLQFARSEWSAAMGQEGRGDVADNVRRKLAGGEYEWSEKGLQNKASAPEAASAPEKAGGPTTPPEAGTLPAAPAEEQGAAPRRKIRRGFSIPFAPLGTPDMIDFIVEQGGIKLPKKAERKQEHDDAPHLTGVYRRLATQFGKISADEMAQMLADNFFIPEAHVPTMWAEIKKSVDSRIRIREQESARDRNEKAATKENKQQSKVFDKDAGPTNPDPQAWPIHAENLAVGDVVEVNGEKLHVTGIDANGDVTLEDGKKYGVQMIHGGEVIYGEHVPGERPAEATAEPAGTHPFSLESASAEQLKAEQEQQRQRDEIKDRQSRRLQGSAGDTTADMFGGGDTPLFNERRDQAKQETPREEAERLRSELGDEAAGKQHGLTPENVKDFYNGTNETGINPHGYGQDGLTMELERRISEQRQSAPAPEGTATAPAAEPKPEEKATAPAAQLADELTAEQHEKIERSVRAAADGFTWRNEAEKESAIAEVLTKVEAGARKMLQGTGSLEHFSAAVLARSRFTDVVRRAEQRRTQNAEGGNGEGEADKGWTQASQDESDGGAQDPSKQLADKEAAAMVLGFDKYTNKGGKAEDKAAAIKAVQKLVAEGVDATPTEVARELGWFTGSGDSQRPDITKVTRILKAASEDILRGTALKRSDVLGILPPGLSEVLAEITAAVSFGSQLWAQFRSPGEWTDWRSRLLRWSQRQQTSWQEVDNMIREARRVAPSEERRAAITNWIEAGGDVNLLRQWEAGSRNGRLRDGYRIAQNLTPEEIAYAQRVSRTYDELFNRGVREGLLDPSTRRQNYVNHVWRIDNVFSRLVGSGSRRLSEYFRNARARTFNTHFEGEQEGYRPRTKDVARLLAGYVVDMNNAIISRRFVRDLATGRGTDGRPLIAPEGRIDVVEQNNGERVYFVYPKSKRADQRDYMPPTRPHPAMMRWLWHAADESGNPILVRDGFILHPEVWEHFNRIFGNNGVNDWLQATGQGPVTRLAKGSLRLVRDVQSMAKQTMLGFLSPFHAVQEGTHAIGHRVNPFFGLPRIDLTASRLQRDAAAHGLMLQPDRVSENQFQEGLGHGQGNLVVNVLRGLRRGLGDNAIGRTPERIADLSDNFQHWLFHQYIPSLKMKTYDHMLERNRARYQDEIAADPTFDSVVKYLSATQSNAAYGHLNYADLGRHPAFQTFLSIGLLAPDFLEARAKFVGQAIKGLTGRNGREQLQAIAFLALAQWSACRVLNKLTDDDWHFDAPFEVIHGARRYRMRSVPEDIYAALHDTRRFIYGRISPIVGKGVLQGLSGVNYRGEPVEFNDTVKELAASVIPLTMQPFTRDLTKTGRQNPVTPWEQMAGSFGIHVARYSPLPNVYKLAADWKKKETGEDATRTVYPESKYAKLRYALEDGDQERAAREWEALLASNPSRPAYKFAAGFKESMTKPLTGSKASDGRFRDSLKGKDREQYERAMQRRQQIMHGFRSMHDEWTKAKEKAAAPKQGAAAGN